MFKEAKAFQVSVLRDLERKIQYGINQTNEAIAGAIVLQNYRAAYELSCQNTGKLDVLYTVKGIIEELEAEEE